MSDWKKRNEDWRDEDELEEEEECECPWVDSKGKVRETAYCQYLLEKHPMMCLKQKQFDQNGEVDEDALLYEVHSDLRDFVLDNLAKKEKQVLDALRIETYTPEWKPQLDRIHLQNGTYFLDERGFVPEKELCLNRLPVEYQPDDPVYQGAEDAGHDRQGRRGKIPHRLAAEEAVRGSLSLRIHPPHRNESLCQCKSGVQAGHGR